MVGLEHPVIASSPSANYQLFEGSNLKKLLLRQQLI